jgi:hypothetical protein
MKVQHTPWHLVYFVDLCHHLDLLQYHDTKGILEHAHKLRVPMKTWYMEFHSQFSYMICGYILQ